MNNKILFCGIDGILNVRGWHEGLGFSPHSPLAKGPIHSTAPWIEQPQAKVLSDLLKDTQAGLVITSRRRTQHTMATFRAILESHGIHPERLGFTDTGEAKKTPQLIRKWWHDSGMPSMASVVFSTIDWNNQVLDDETLETWNSEGNFHLHDLQIIDQRFGITTHDADKARMSFREMDEESIRHQHDSPVLTTEDIKYHG